MLTPLRSVFDSYAYSIQSFRITPGNILFYQAIWILAQRTNFFVMACVSQTSLNVMANQIALMELMSWDVVSL